MAGLTLALKATVRLSAEADAVEEPGRKRLRLPAPSAIQQAFLRALAEGASTEEELLRGHGQATTLELRYLLAVLEQEGWLGYALTQGERLLASLEPLARDFRWHPASGPGAWRLSRFAWLRRLETGTLVLESALGFGRVAFHEPWLLALVGRLCEPRTPEQLAGGSELAPALARPFRSLLASAGAIAPCSPEVPLPEDRDPALRQWEFHDLLFHSRSREGRHGAPIGGTFRFLGELEPQPGLKPARSGPGLPLPEPGLPGPEPPFFSVLDARRSLRVPRQEPLTLAQLATFLHYVARVRGVVPADAQAGRFYDAVAGPCPGGGGLHELELYLTVARCAGLEPGFYHYAAGTHRLEPWPGASSAPGQLLSQAREAMGQSAPPDVLITLAARVQRASWKYQSIAYALILKNTGVVFQQMYLVATALGLSPCAIGSGDTQVFAQASGLAFTQETSVGEFALSG